MATNCLMSSLQRSIFTREILWNKLDLPYLRQSYRKGTRHLEVSERVEVLKFKELLIR